MRATHRTLLKYTRQQHSLFCLTSQFASQCRQISTYVENLKYPDQTPLVSEVLPRRSSARNLHFHSNELIADLGRNFTQPLDHFGLPITSHSLSKKLNIKKGSPINSISRPKTQVRNTARLAARYGASAARLQPTVANMWLAFRQRKTFRTSLTEPSKIKSDISFTSLKPIQKSSIDHEYRRQYSVACRSFAAASQVELGSCETEDLAKQLDRKLSLIVSESFQPNPKLQIPDCLELTFRRISAWKRGAFDIFDPYVAHRLLDSLRNYLRTSETVRSITHTCSLQVETRQNQEAAGAWRKFHPDRTRSQIDGMGHRAFIAVGSNLGDRLAHIEEAAAKMERLGVKICRFGHVYETSPMYLTEQPSFLNTVCEVETDLEPLQLLDLLQSVESALGRVRTIEKGPRTIDLDILLYDNQRLSSERLSIPHNLMFERAFVLKPLCDLTPTLRPPPPYSSRTVEEYLKLVEGSEPSNHDLPAISVLSRRLSLYYPKDPSRQTRIMTVINLTPDSFSDGGLHDPLNPDKLRRTVLQALDAGTDILDIGGQSTRPDAAPVSAEEELNRILPVIQLIRSMPEAEKTTIGVDTFLASVAEHAIHAGADVINDISAGRLDEKMFSTVAELKVPIVLMHSRGTPKTMKEMTIYPSGLLEEIADELAERVRLAELAGVRRWHIILDPGIGFAKNQSQNLELLRRLDDLKKDPRLHGFPWLVGTSRKGFIGKVTGVTKANERVWGTAAAVTASIQGGADIVRIHDFAEMSQVVKMADAMFRVDDSFKASTIDSK